LCAAPKRKTDTTLAEWRTWSYVAIAAEARATPDMSEHPIRRATVLGRGTSTAALAAEGVTSRGVRLAEWVTSPKAAEQAQSDSGPWEACHQPPAPGMIDPR